MDVGCALQQTWAEVRDATIAILDNTTFASLVERSGGRWEAIREPLPAVVAEGSAGVLLVLVAAKGLAYALSLGAGFRGGPVFPAIAIGVAAAMVAANVLPGLDTTPAVAAGIAAGTTAVLRVPFTAVLLVSLLMGASAFDVAPIAVLAAAIAWLVATMLPNPEDSVQRKAVEAVPAPAA